MSKQVVITQSLQQTVEQRALQLRQEHIRKTAELRDYLAQVNNGI
jgi:hypothetical protein